MHYSADGEWQLMWITWEFNNQTSYDRLMLDSSAQNRITHRNGWPTFEFVFWSASLQKWQAADDVFNRDASRADVGASSPQQTPALVEERLSNRRPRLNRRCTARTDICQNTAEHALSGVWMQAVQFIQVESALYKLSLNYWQIICFVIRT